MDAQAITAACHEAMNAARENPGRYGGRYVARALKGTIHVLDHDDPDRLTDEWNVLAHVTPDAVHAVGRARAWLNTDGSVSPPPFLRDPSP